MNDSSSTLSTIKEFINLYSQGSYFECQIYRLFDLKSYEVKGSVYHMQFEIIVPGTMADAYGNIFRGVFVCILDSCTSLLLSVVTMTSSVSVQLSISYNQNAKPGEVLCIDAVCMKTGINIYFVNATIKCNDKLIAFGAQTKQMKFPSPFKI
jgi:acyl-coenzyme A thioesterase PaaI-like protein